MIDSIDCYRSIYLSVCLSTRAHWLCQDDRPTARHSLGHLNDETQVSPSLYPLPYFS